MSTVRSSAATSATSLLAAVTSAATVVTVNLDSLAQLSTAGNHRARAYAKRVKDECEERDRYARARAKHENAKALADLKKEIATLLEDPLYAKLYQESVAELSA